MSSKKTLASGKQMLTVAGRIINGLTPVEIDLSTALFWIDHPKAVNCRAALFAKRPTVVHVIGYRLGEARGLASLIEGWWSEKFDIFAIDTILDREMNIELIQIYSCADIVVVDTAELYSIVVKKLEKDGRNFTTQIFFINTDPTTIPIVGKNVRICKNSAEALKWFGVLQMKKINAELEDRFSEFAHR